MNIIYFGDTSPGATSRHRADALQRIGCTVALADPYLGLGGAESGSFWNRVHFRTGYRLLQPYFKKWVGQVMQQHRRPDLIWINGGELFGPGCLQTLRESGCPIVLYNNDNPTGSRDGARFQCLLEALPFYDVCAARAITASEMRDYGARHTTEIWMSYDEVAHAPYPSLADIPASLRSEVAFIGTWMRYEGRDRFLLDLIRAGVPISIWGNRWQKSPLWAELQRHWKGGALSGRNYVGALQGAKLCIGLLSRGNRDLHTRRSLETPYAGGLLCAERTLEHGHLYEEGKEAVFWSDAGECADVCKRLLADDDERERIRLAGMQRVRTLELGNEDVCRRILTLCQKVGASMVPRSAWLSSGRLRVLYLGNTAPRTTSRQRAEALRRIGCEVKMADPYADLGEHSGNPLRGRLQFHIGYRFLQRRANKWAAAMLREYPAPDLIWVNGGELLGPGCLETLRRSGCPIVLYNNDDPTGTRDSRRFDMLVRSLPLYDLCVAVREITALEMRQRGAPRVLRVWMSYDELAHAPFADPAQIPEHLRSEVAFIGTWMRHENRDRFLLDLIQAGVPVSIWGDRWQKAPTWPQLRKFWRGPSIAGTDYVGAIQGAKLCIGLLSKGNRDLHTTRTMEIPYAGGLLCAQRTEEHIELFQENKEAVFWSTTEECVQICQDLLAHPEKREKIRLAGMAKIRTLPVSNEAVCRQVLAALGLSSSRPVKPSAADPDFLDEKRPAIQEAG